MAAMGSHNYINFPANYRTLGCLLPGTTLWLQWDFSLHPLWLITQDLQQLLRTRLDLNKEFDRNLTALSKSLIAGGDKRVSDLVIEASWNAMAHAQKPDFLFRRKGRVHLNRRGRQFSRLLAAEVCASAIMVVSNTGYTMLRGSEKPTGYPLHSQVSPSLPLPCVTVCHHISAGV